MTPTATDHGAHRLTSGPRYLGQSLRQVVASDEGRGYLEWVRRGGGTFASEDLAAIRQFLRLHRKPSVDAQPVRHWPSAFIPSKRRETS